MTPTTSVGARVDAIIADLYYTRARARRAAAEFADLEADVPISASTGGALREARIAASEAEGELEDAVTKLADAVAKLHNATAAVARKLP